MTNYKQSWLNMIKRIEELKKFMEEARDHIEMEMEK